MALAAAGKDEEAVAAYRRAIEFTPAASVVHYNLSLTLLRQGKLDAALGSLHRSIELRPDYSEAYNQISITLKRQGRLDQVVVYSRRAIELNPKLPEVHYGLALLFIIQQRWDDAITTCRTALSLKPDYAEAMALLSVALQSKGLISEALPFARAAVSLAPASAAAQHALGRVLAEADDTDDEAIACFRRAIAIEPAAPDAYNALANVLQRHGKYAEAIAIYERCLLVRSDHAPAYWNKSLALLSIGEFARGWAEYEWRWHCKDLVPHPRQFQKPRWDGTALGGRTLLLHAEQGFGDTNQFVRYAPLAAATGGKVILECPGELLRLLESVPGIAQVVRAGDPLPHFDVQLPLMSAPLVFGTSLETIPGKVPYLFVPPSRAKVWAARVDAYKGLKVGIAWAGRPEHKNDRRRSIPLRRFVELARLPGARLFSLQMGAAATELAEEATYGIIDLTDKIVAFADTAALVSSLDLVITVDTAVAHLAGAMGKSAWVVLQPGSDWRWLIDRNDSPWYPTTRIVRRNICEPWREFAVRMARQLEFVPPPLIT